MFDLNEVVVDWAKAGTMLAVSQWLAGKSLNNAAWQKSTLFTLLGFTAYQVTKHAVPENVDGVARAVVDDTVKFGTMFAVSRVLAGGNLNNRAWLMSCLYVIVGFAVYNVVVANYVRGSDHTQNPKVQALVDDWAKVGTMLVVSRLLGGGSVRDNAWMMSSLGTLLGFSVYDVVVSHAVDKVQERL